MGISNRNIPCRGIHGYHLRVRLSFHHTRTVHFYAPERTEEMRPQWFTIPPDDEVSDASIASPDPPYIPSDEMWEGDSFWLPLLIANRPFVGRADFRKGDEDAFTLQKWWFGVTA